MLLAVDGRDHDGRRRRWTVRKPELVACGSVCTTGFTCNKRILNAIGGRFCVYSMCIIPYHPSHNQHATTHLCDDVNVAHAGLEFPILLDRNLVWLTYSNRCCSCYRGHVLTVVKMAKQSYFGCVHPFLKNTFKLLIAGANHKVQCLHHGSDDSHVWCMIFFFSNTSLRTAVTISMCVSTAVHSENAEKPEGRRTQIELIEKYSSSAGPMKTFRNYAPNSHCFVECHLLY